MNKHKPGDRVHLSGVFEGKMGTVIQQGAHYGVKVDGYTYTRGGLEFHSFSPHGLRSHADGPFKRPEPTLNPPFQPFSLAGSLPEGLPIRADAGGMLLLGCIQVPAVEVKQALQDLLVDGKKTSGRFIWRKPGIQFGANWITWDAARQFKAELDKVETCSDTSAIHFSHVPMTDAEKEVIKLQNKIGDALSLIEGKPNDGETHEQIREKLRSILKEV